MLDVPSHAQIRAVDLEDEAPPCDRLVFLPHRVGDREQVRFLGRVVLVAEEERHDARRGGRQERVFDLDARERRLQVVDVGLRRLRVAHADRRVARRRLPARAPGVAEHALGEVGEADEILVDERVAGAAEAGEAILDVGRVARLAHLAVVDDVHARLGLLADDLLDGGRDATRQRSRVDRHAFLLRVHHPDQVLGPRQAARVGREEPFSAALHCDPFAEVGHRNPPRRRALVKARGLLAGRLCG